uniref:C2H2-type domain-containing protein n=1 Tax=viral metagenome TaxID=1070528 RepID=A0A6C0HPH9_9ZZZZ
MVARFSANSAQEKFCADCDVLCLRKNDWDRHILTHKHFGNTLVARFSATTITYNCDKCKKVYKSRKGLWGHSKKCMTNAANAVETNIISELRRENQEFKTILLDLVKNNNELQKQIVDVSKNIHINTNNVNNTINNNNTFNLNFFLNEHCKDAMNISDFINTIDLKFSDLENIGQIGYVDGLSKLIIGKLEKMDVYKRPLHCSDIKRETIYVKDENIWEKETELNPKLRKTIQQLSFKHIQLASKWSEEHPECKNTDSKMNDIYMSIIKQTTGGDGILSMNEDKIIKRISKEVVVEKV